MATHEYRPDAFTGTPFNAAAAPLSQTSLWIGWGPYHLVDHYTDVIDETLAIRTTAAIEDKTPLVKTFFRGPDAERFVNSMQVRDASRIDIHHTNYTFWCDESGHTVTEGLFFRVEEDKFCHMSAPLKEWCLAHADGYDVDIYEAPEADEDFGVLCIQGPRSLEIINEVAGLDLSDLGFSRGRTITIDGAEILIWRTGFTGELGFEMWVPPAASPDVFEMFVQEGAKHGAIPIGNAAQDIARVEVGMLISGTDYRPAGPAAQVQATYMSEDEYLQTPAELGFGRLVNLAGDRQFVGKAALLRERETGPKRLMKGLLVNWHDIVMMWEEQGSPPFVSPRVQRGYVPGVRKPDGNRIGFATSITWSPNLNEMIGLARVDADRARELDEVLVDWKAREVSTQIRAKLVDLPFAEMRRV
ncbi:MAG: aminomethyltransferase family protein [Acidimicrobiia bacterium]|nr:aminomethyltransferase family protein [Acidimicrobiia bacterium]